MADLDFAFDDEVFIQKAERKLPKVQRSYDAKEDTDGWFHNYQDYKSVMEEKHGPNQLKSAIEHDYLHKRYDRALQVALAYIEIVDSGKVKITNAREMCEIGVHCAVRLGKLDIAEKLLDRTTSSSEPGTLQLQGKVYPLCGRPRDGVAALMRYNTMRRSNYQTFRDLASIFYNPEQHGCMRNHLARLCIERAHKIMTSSRWALNVEHVRRRYDLELKQLEEQMDQIIKSGGETVCFVTWMQQQLTPISAEQMATVGLDAYNPEDIKAIYKEYVKHSDDTIDETADSNEIRNVREL